MIRATATRIGLLFRIIAGLLFRTIAGAIVHRSDMVGFRVVQGEIGQRLVLYVPRDGVGEALPNSGANALVRSPMELERFVRGPFEELALFVVPAAPEGSVHRFDYIRGRHNEKTEEVGN